MKRSYLMAACLALAAVFTACWRTTRDAADQVYLAYRQVKDWLAGHALSACKLATPKDETAKRPVVRLIQAKAFVLRLAKRERPELTGSWRMCPST